MTKDRTKYCHRCAKAFNTSTSKIYRQQWYFLCKAVLKVKKLKILFISTGNWKK